MKRFFFTLTLALGLFSLSSFANDNDDVSPVALASFKTSFKNANEVSWSVNDLYYKASFTMNGQYIAAFYDLEGKMVAMTRNITSIQLPLSLQSSLKKHYGGYWISDLFEMANDGVTSYYITIENGDSRIVLKATSNSDWSSYKKQRKS
jgi:hypothetical protein